MPTFQFDGILTNGGWLDPAFVNIDENGKIIEISKDEIEGAQAIGGYAIAGFQNAHSHAFQYAMAALAEKASTQNQEDDFWSWREIMYKLSESITPETMKSIASMLYSEMLRNGYTSVAEFHYLHHRQSGGRYEKISEMSLALIDAADETGINLTLTPVYYRTGGTERFRFKKTAEYFQLLEELKKIQSERQTFQLAAGVHSLRAAGADEVKEIFYNLPADMPKHIHVAEQKKEIEEIKNSYGKRPIQWLLDELDMNDSFNLVHATHANESEIQGVIAQKANIVLCPSTEGNLGDGFFNIKDFISGNGKFSIGSDSHVGLSPMEELRWIDYQWRLKECKRIPFSTGNGKDSGEQLFNMAFKSGLKAMGQGSDGFFELGQPFNAVVLSKNHPLISTRSPNTRISTLIYCADSSVFTHVITQGKIQIKNGIHKNLEIIKKNYASAIHTLPL